MTQEEKIIHEICSQRVIRKSKKEWYYPPDFMQRGEFFVGYEASARLSGMARKYPEMIESKKVGKYFYRRIRYEKIKEWWNTIPWKYRAIFSRYNIKAER